MTGVQTCALPIFRLGSGTQSFVAGPAMTAEQAVAGLVAGSDLAHELADDGVTLIALGEMGIGNTTSAAALLAALVPADPADVCGHGTGLDDDGLARKIAVVERGLALHAPAPSDSVGALAAVGGFEIAVLAGAILGSCARSIPIVLDGLIVGLAGLVTLIVGVHARSRLGGVTGDTLGATSELSETTGLVLLSALG